MNNIAIMRLYLHTIRVICFLLFSISLNGQQSDMQNTTLQQIVDIVWLKDGSKLSGTILQWELARGMEFKLVTGAIIQIPKDSIAKVYQDIPFNSASPNDPMEYHRGPRPYAFKEEGMYHTISVFLDFSEFGGAGVHYSIGYKFSRMLGVGIGSGFESHDFFETRNIVPLYAEARGYFVPKKISPYYAVKIGYGFALENELNGTIDAKGGFYFCPELGVRFGGKNVNYYVGLEYLLQNATFTNTFWDWDPQQGTYTDIVGYRRVELRTGLLF